MLLAGIGDPGLLLNRADGGASSASPRGQASQELRPPMKSPRLKPEQECLVAGRVAQGLSARRVKKLIS